MHSFNKKICKLTQPYLEYKFASLIAVLMVSSKFPLYLGVPIRKFLASELIDLAPENETSGFRNFTHFWKNQGGHR